MVFPASREWDYMVPVLVGSTAIRTGVSKDSRAVTQHSCSDTLNRCAEQLRPPQRRRCDYDISISVPPLLRDSESVFVILPVVLTGESRKPLLLAYAICSPYVLSVFGSGER